MKNLLIFLFASVLPFCVFAQEKIIDMKTTTVVYTDGTIKQMIQYTVEIGGTEDVAVETHHYCKWDDDDDRIECTGGKCKVSTINGGGQCLECYGGEFDGDRLCGPDDFVSYPDNEILQIQSVINS